MKHNEMYIIGISHKTAPVAIRELFSFTQEEQETFLERLRSSEHIQECVVLSTCNRSEVYFSGDGQALQEMENRLAEFKNSKAEHLLKYFLVYQGEKAIRHLFQVTCGMDSMVLGEDEILGQVKAAYARAHDLGSAKYLLNTLFQAAITCAKKVKTKTKLSKTPVSIGTLAANEIFHFPKENKTVLIIGLTGKMGSIVMKNIYGKPGIKIIGTSRNHQSIETISREYRNVSMVDYQLRYHYMDQADVIISATTSPHYTVTCLELEEKLSVEKERLFLDLSVPMDMDKEIAGLSRVTLHDIDYFDRAAADNAQVKEQEIDQAQTIIEEQLEEVKKQLTFHEFVTDLPLICRRMEKVSFETVLYEIKNQATSEELSVILGVLKKLV